MSGRRGRDAGKADGGHEHSPRDLRPQHGRGRGHSA